MNRIITNKISRFVYKYFVALFMGVGLFLVISGSTYRSYIIGKPIAIDKSEIERNINSYFTQTLPLCEQWLESSNDEKFISNLWKIETPNDWKDGRVSLFLYKEDSMLLWANHIYKSDFDPLNLPVTDSIFQYESEKLLVKRHFRDNKQAIVVLNLYNTDNGLNTEIFTDERLEIVSSPLDKATISMGNNFYIQPHRHSGVPLILSLSLWLGVLLVMLAVKRIFRRLTRKNNAFTINFIYLFLLITLGYLFVISDIRITYGRLFSTVIFSVESVDISLGKLLVCFSLLLIYTVYLYRIRHKLAYCYKRLGKLSRNLLLFAMLLFVDFIVVFFHYAMVNVIYHTSINIELYKFTLIDFNTIIFYMIGALFMTSRIMINNVVTTIFTSFPITKLILYSIVILALMIIPIEGAISNTGYILLIFHIAFLLVAFVNAKMVWQYVYAMTVTVFSIYIVLFATIESNIADTHNTKMYAQKLAYESRLSVESQEIYKKLTYYKIYDDNKIEVKDNNSVDLQQLTRIIELGVDTTVNAGGYVHFLFHARNGQTVIVSRQQTTLLDYVSLFSYVFIVLYLIVGLFLKLASYRHKYIIRRSRFALRIRVVVIGVVLFTMSLVVVVITLNTFDDYDVTTRKIVNNETQMLLHSFEQYAEHSTVGNEGLLLDWFLNNGEVIGKDVTIYDTQGNFLASYIVNRAYSKINSSAYSALHWNGAPLYNRSIDYRNRTYSSAYLPMSFNGELLGYINLIRLDRANDLASDPRYDVLTSIFNILIVVILISVIISMLLYRAISLPLTKLHNGMYNISALRKIEESRSNDEIATLIRQYNLMIDYLEESYEALARSEREGAWREMARQVAHEIKNPLTPMRLKIQMLQRAKQRGDEDLNTRMDNTLEMLLEQIDLLAKIASEFSDFARMSETRIERVNVSGLLSAMNDLYANNSDILFVVKPPIEPMEVSVDNSQIMRVLINLCQNAMQAVAGTVNPRVELSAEREGDNVVISVSDNGSGISLETRKRIFEPNFTTKSSGSGIGLAMSRQIVLNFGGMIAFESEEHVKTTFTVTLPLFDNRV